MGERLKLTDEEYTLIIKTLNYRIKRLSQTRSFQTGKNVEELDIAQQRCIDLSHKMQDHRNDILGL